VNRKKIKIGLVGLGLMGKEFVSAAARYCHLIDDGPVPEITGVCFHRPESKNWYVENVPTLQIVTDNLSEFLSSDKIDAVYIAVPHNLHESFYIKTIESGKHLLGEKPFGINLKANRAILKVAYNHPEIIVRCMSQYVYWPGAKRVVDWVRAGKCGRIFEARAGFYHSSDLDLEKPINWKRRIETNGEYGCMGDLGAHIQWIPLRLGWKISSVYADLSDIVKTRPDGKGGTAACETWDNAVLLCRAEASRGGDDFPLTFETKRISPGDTNTWSIEIRGTESCVRFSTKNPKAFYYLENEGRIQGWTRMDIGPESYIPTISGGIFEFGFSDTMIQMLAAFLWEFRDDGRKHPFPLLSKEESEKTHLLMTAALESHRRSQRISTNI
jgi:predicted dehydrogenase